MQYFGKYVSNTLAASGNQFFFCNGDETEVFTGRLFYKVFEGGKYTYSFLFSNTLDSTYGDGSVSQKNLVCGKWKIVRSAVAVCNTSEPEMCDESSFSPLLFGGNTEKNVSPGEMFATDGIELKADKGQYICVEISFCGKMIPYHEETMIATYLNINGQWVPDKKMPFPCMTGCDRPVKKRVAFFGDSITQGIGVPFNEYSFWDAVTAEKIGSQFSFWNLGIGYGRADDAGSNGAWMYKAKQNDIVVVCFGVNDIMQGFSEEKIKTNLFKTVTELKKSGAKVLLQTVPPFCYENEKKIIWQNVNRYILNELSKYCDKVFDVVPFLGESTENPQNPKYGGHPNKEGSDVWANALFPVLNTLCNEA